MQLHLVINIMKVKVILPTIMVFIITLLSFIILLNVLSGNIGNKENWRIIFSLIGFIIPLIATVLLVHHIIKSNVS